MCIGHLRRHFCRHIHIDGCRDMCAHMCIDMCVGMSVDMRVGMHIDVCIDMCVELPAQQLQQMRNRVEPATTRRQKECWHEAVLAQKQCWHEVLLGATCYGSQVRGHRLGATIKGEAG